MFVKDSRIAITRGNNTIVIREKLNYGQMARVKSAGLIVKVQAGANGKDVYDMSINQAQFEMQLLIESIVDWHGPAFAGVPCNVDNILRLDQSEPLVQEVITAVSGRNKGNDEDPKDGAPSGEESLNVADVPQLTGSTSD